MKNTRPIAFNKRFFLKVIFMAKLYLIVFFSSMLTANAKVSNAQKLNLKLKLENVKLLDVVNALKKQIDFEFAYDASLESTAFNHVAIDVKEEKIENILSNLLDGKNIKFKVINQIVLLSSKEIEVVSSKSKASFKVTGKVISFKDQTAIPGVSVIEKGTNNGTITDIDGIYHLTVSSESAILQLSFIGFETTEVNVGGKTEVNVSLNEKLNEIEQVVVVGYGSQKRATVTGSVVSTKGDDIKISPAASVANNLVGRLPGLIAMNRGGEPGYDDSKLLIRGNSTTGDSSPLVVIDGIADRAGGFSRIDPNDIESISVLKDASAAIYGSRAANGVILVTTKRGKSGKPSVNYTLDYGIKQPTVLPKMCGSADYATALNEIETSIYGRTPMYTAAQIQKFRDGSDPVNYPNVNWMDEALRKYSSTTKHNLSVSGGNDVVKYFTSLGYLFDDNYYKNSASNFKQYNLRSNIDIQVNKSLKIFANLSARQEDRNSPHYGSESIWRYLVKGDPRVNIVWPGTNYPVTAPQDDFNPVTSADGTMGYQRNKSTYINADLGFTWDLSSLTEGLSLEGGFSADKGNTFYKHFQKAFYLYAKDNTTGAYIPKQYGPSNALLEENMNQNVGLTANIKLRYNKTFGQQKISAFAAYEQYENYYDYLYGKRQDYVGTSIDQLFAGDKKTQLNDGTSSESARQNYFGRLDYSFAEKYLVQFNCRYDGSQNFPSSNRFGFFPGVSLGWRVSEEPFWKNYVPVVEYFKLRGSWGQMGNDKIGNQYAYMTMYSYGSSATFGGSNPQSYTGLQQTVTGNPNIHWEVATTYNLGFETKFLNNKLSFDLDLFKSYRNQILRSNNAAIPDYTGLVLPPENIGKCETKGFEAAIGYNNKVGELKYNISGNLSYAEGKVVYIGEPANTLSYQKLEGNLIGAYSGMYDAIGIYRTQADLDKYPHMSNVKLGDLIFRDVNDDKVIDGKDQITTDKSNTPKIIYGLNLGLEYKNWGLSMLWQGAAKVYQYVFWESGSIGNFTQDYFDNRYTADNINSKYPRVYDRQATEVGLYNTFWLQDASYLRLKSLQLSYSLPKNIVSKLHAESLRLSVSGYNLLTFTGLKDIDPETVAGSQNFASWSTPQSKILNFGLNLTF